MRQFCKRSRHLIALLALCLGTALAAPAPEDGARLIERSFTRAVEGLQAREQAIREDPGAAYALLESELAPHIDFELVSRLVLARHWRGANPRQRQAFVAAFRESLLRTYALLLAEHATTAVAHLEGRERLLETEPVREVRNGRMLLRTRLLTNGPAVSIDYRMRVDEDRWKVYDVIIEGISFIANRRAELASLLGRQSLDELIAQLEARNRRLAGARPKSAAR
ncbi:phospholipid-binding protein MlaC [Alkalilimnicola sp. S0819]|uniref:MlaC/ttg2D family ABC transporter substrate-binding protein n=1 Tax=Alkalilimnicola sp. S0819 TaxID=2613922 RepID=UPI001261D1D4|nr:ABC transporter substrate-binding protein [Alkalilimnicola sp. S0819]KAB7622787.1 ABC transporter substrate-binding protein [Alkalilimnicola sp. S0819]MPQ17283.1 hypothetical protein [Alkalilimnicola sp. S0819]